MTTPQLPPSLTVTVTPWGGTYADRRNNTNDGTVSYYGPQASGTFRAKVRPDGWEQDWDIPTLHITLNPAAPAQNFHVSLEMGRGGGMKNAHRHWNNGAPWWDLSALDGHKEDWVNAVETKYPGAVDRVLNEVTTQITSGVAPVYTPPTASTPQPPTFSSDDFPALPSRQPSVTTAAAVVDAQQQPVAAQDPSAHVQPVYDQAAYAPSVYAQPDDEQVDPNAPSASDAVYQPTGTERPWGAVGEEVPVIAYLDEQIGANDEEEEWCNFALSDGRSMGVAKVALEQAITGQVNVPWAAPWVSVYWNQEYFTVPEGIFTQT